MTGIDVADRMKEPIVYLQESFTGIANLPSDEVHSYWYSKTRPHIFEINLNEYDRALTAMHDVINSNGSSSMFYITLPEVLTAIKTIDDALHDNDGAGASDIAAQTASNIGKLLNDYQRHVQQEELIIRN